MITKEKLKIFEYYKGDVDAFGHGSNRHRKVMNDQDFFLIAGFTQDIALIMKGLASKEFEKNTNNKIKAECDSVDTVEALKAL